jgi:hypothetical protein
MTIISSKAIFEFQPSEHGNDTFTNNIDKGREAETGSTQQDSLEKPKFDPALPFGGEREVHKSPSACLAHWACKQGLCGDIIGGVVPDDQGRAKAGA